MVLLLFAGIQLVFGNEFYAKRIAMWSYYFLVIGVIGLAVEHMRTGMKRK